MNIKGYLYPKSTKLYPKDYTLGSPVCVIPNTISISLNSVAVSAVYFGVREELDSHSLIINSGGCAVSAGTDVAIAISIYPLSVVQQPINVIGRINTQAQVNTLSLSVNANSVGIGTAAHVSSLNIPLTQISAGFAVHLSLSPLLLNVNINEFNAIIIAGTSLSSYPLTISQVALKDVIISVAPININTKVSRFFLPSLPLNLPNWTSKLEYIISRESVSYGGYIYPIYSVNTLKVAIHSGGAAVSSIPSSSHHLNVKPHGVKIVVKEIDYQAKIHFDIDFIASYIRISFNDTLPNLDDLRVTDEDGNELDFWVIYTYVGGAYYGSPHLIRAGIYVRLPYLSSDKDARIFLWVGNRCCEPKSNKDAIGFYYVDDFSEDTSNNYEVYHGDSNGFHIDTENQCLVFDSKDVGIVLKNQIPSNKYSVVIYTYDAPCFKVDTWESGDQFCFYLAGRLGDKQDGNPAELTWCRFYGDVPVGQYYVSAWWTFFYDFNWNRVVYEDNIEDDVNGDIVGSCGDVDNAQNPEPSRGCLYNEIVFNVDYNTKKYSSYLVQGPSWYPYGDVEGLASKGNIPDDVTIGKAGIRINESICITPVPSSHKYSYSRFIVKRNYNKETIFNFISCQVNTTLRTLVINAYPNKASVKVEYPEKVALETRNLSVSLCPVSLAFSFFANVVSLDLSTSLASVKTNSIFNLQTQELDIGAIGPTIYSNLHLSLDSFFLTLEVNTSNVSISWKHFVKSIFLGLNPRGLNIYSSQHLYLNSKLLDIGQIEKVIRANTRVYSHTFSLDLNLFLLFCISSNYLQLLPIFLFIKQLFSWVNIADKIPCKNFVLEDKERLFELEQSVSFIFPDKETSFILKPSPIFVLKKNLKYFILPKRESFFVMEGKKKVFVLPYIKTEFEQYKY